MKALKIILATLAVLVIGALVSIPITRSWVGPGNDPLGTGYFMENWEGPLATDRPWYLIHMKTDRIRYDDGKELPHITLYTFFGIPYRGYMYLGPKVHPALFSLW